jgi:hypothetical protein
VRLSLLLLFFAFIQTSFIPFTDQTLNLSELQTVKERNVSSYEEDKEVAFYESKQLIIRAGISYHILLNQPFTSAKVTWLKAQQELLLNSEKETYQLGEIVLNDDMESPSNFIIFQHPFNQLEMKGIADDTLTLELFYAPPIQLASQPKKNKSEYQCTEPATISYDIWRAGLPEPIPGRVPTEVKHCIVHHSAGSNTDTNYTNVVRNIYLFHTQSNGWDDIGYNYLIAQNGDIYDGRDPQEQGSQDEIQGAHFCAKNSGTMGICLLGNYNTTNPTDTSLKSLERLLTFKLHKEELSAFDAFNHPNSLGSSLPVIAGHKDGCATACPGTNLYNRLPVLRDTVQKQLDQCNPIAATFKPQKRYKLLVYPNPSPGRFYAMIERDAHANRYSLMTMDGREIEHGNLPNNGFIQTAVADGLYYLNLWSDGELLSQSKLIISKH